MRTSSTATRRRNKVLKLLQDHGQVNVNDLSNTFQVSLETVRGDLKRLETDNHLIRTHGGAIAKPVDSVPYFSRLQDNILAKQTIAKQAATLVKPHNRLFLDASSTSFFLARELASLDNLTIITDAVRVVMELAANPSLRIICVGGALRSSSYSLVGRSAVESVEKYHADLFFSSCTGLTKNEGATESDEFEIEVKQAMARRADRTVLLADHTKFGKVGLSQFLELKKISLIVTDVVNEDLLNQFPMILNQEQLFNQKKLSTVR
ncbi:MAG: DeoR/GlpR family DNA-binding transcription regulator [Deltaproteobacteria bacterium]|jgi:DeoR/GlpR family transcriptional regulator of sugar metabolism|nr:DeoR/GlpR family DNA-binding transcription regulator [Deltaproteobacteria bacterium]